MKWRYDCTILDLGTRCEVNGQFHVLTAFLPWKIVPSPSCIADCVGARAALDDMKIEICYPYLD
jgi:hypothetical protein